MIQTNSVIVYSPLCCSLYFLKIFKLFNLYNECQRGTTIIALHSLSCIMYRTKRDMVPFQSVTPSHVGWPTNWDLARETYPLRV